jgi:pimeloyl-ACP methyl ester carboxylesterase
VVDSVYDIAQSITALVEQGICTHGKLAIFSVSFSGIQALHAAAQDTVRDKVSGILALGTGYTYHTTFQHAFASGSEADLYTQLILLRNLILLSNVGNAELDQAFLLAVEYVYKNNDMAQLNTIISENFSEECKRQFEVYIEDLQSERTFLQKYANTIKELDFAFTASGDLANLKCPVFLVHSVSDKVLMPSESIALYRKLKSQHISVTLTITPLLEHVDHQISLRKVRELFALLNNFAGFFGAAHN